MRRFLTLYYYHYLILGEIFRKSFVESLTICTKCGIILLSIHIVELEEFLRAATDNDPEKRPTMKEFNGMLKQWLSMEPENIHSHTVQYSEWRFINKLLFGEETLFTPETACWEDNDRIRDVLSLIATLPAFNHMLFVKGGLISLALKILMNQTVYIFMKITLQML